MKTDMAKQCRCWLDFPFRSSLIWVYTVCPDLSEYLGSLEPAHEIMALFVLHKLNLQMHMLGVRSLIFGRTLHLLPYFMCANSEGSSETAGMRRLAWAFAGCLCDKYHNLIVVFKNWKECNRKSLPTREGSMSWISVHLLYILWTFSYFIRPYKNKFESRLSKTYRTSCTFMRSD